MRPNRPNRICAIGGIVSLLLMTGAAQGAPAPYPSMAPREQYLIADPSEEIALARSAAPPSISDDAGVMILGARGFETAAKGTNGFVCLVERAWDKPFDDPEFWNPKMRANMAPATGAMSYMMSKQQYLSDDGGRWHPHVMFFSPSTDPAAWGANLRDSPVVGAENSAQVTIFSIPVRKWSDGTLADYGPPAASGEPHHH
jgi:hypothetical protein